MTNRELIDRLKSARRLELSQWEQLFASYTKDELDYAMMLARETAVGIFGKKIYFRGIIEFTNICKNDCYYCGIRCSNKNVSRYRLEKEDILLACKDGYENGFRTFVLQGGEDAYFNDERMCDIVGSIKERYPDCAVTLSLGERSRESYEKLFEAGAERYLLRHETANKTHYEKLHPSYQHFENRMRCLRDLKDIGYQTGCGIMVGTPFQTPRCLAEDMVFMQEFRPEMIGVGPFIPHSETPFKDEERGSVEDTLFVLALCRLMSPQVLLPSTTALGTAEAEGRKRGVLAGCNVVMPNLSPMSVRKKYMLYDNKSGTDMSAAMGIAALSRQMDEIGYEVIIGRGDFGKEETK